MKYELKTLKDKKVEVEISLDAKEWEAAIEDAYKKTKGKFNIHGFRKGAAPRKVIEKTYGTTIFFEDAIDGCFYRY